MRCCLYCMRRRPVGAPPVSPGRRSCECTAACLQGLQPLSKVLVRGPAGEPAGPQQGLKYPALQVLGVYQAGVYLWKCQDTSVSEVALYGAGYHAFLEWYGVNNTCAPAYFCQRHQVWCDLILRCLLSSQSHRVWYSFRCEASNIVWAAPVRAHLSLRVDLRRSQLGNLMSAFIPHTA